MKLSIITINYNNLVGLRTTLESVLKQSFQDFEYLIIDGGSTDGSRELIVQYEYRLSYWCSERDSGVYNAMNKGILQAQGDYLLFLNSGDYLANENILENVVSYLSGSDIVYGDLTFVWKDGHRMIATYPDVLDLRYLLEGSLAHPASFIKRSLFEGCLYSESYRIVSDWEFWVKKIVLEEVSYLHLPMVISIFDTEGISSDMEKCNREREQVLRQLFPGMVYPALQSWCRMQSQPFYPLFEELSHTHRFQRRIQPLIRFLLRIDRLVGKKRR